MKTALKNVISGFSAILLASLLSSCAAPLAPSGDIAQGVCGPVGATSSLQEIKVANGGVTEAPAVEWGKQQGCFEKYGLEVANSVIEDAEAVAALQSGSVQVISLSVLDLVLFSSNGNLDLKVIAPSTGYSQEELDRAKQEPLYPGELIIQSTVLVAQNSDIYSFADLEGKVVGGQGPANQSAWAIMAAVTANGADSSKVEILDVPRDARQSALERGEVDAIVMTGRLASEGIESGLRLVGYPGAYFYDEGPLNLWVTSASTLASQPDLIQDFRDSILLTNSELMNKEKNSSSYRKVLVDIFGLTEEEANGTPIPNYWVQEVSLPNLQRMAAKLSSLEVLNQTADLSSLLDSR